MGDTSQVGQKSEVIAEPENYEQMKQKYLEREEERLKKVLESRKAETKQELQDIASKAIVKRSLRTDQKPLKDRTILRESMSPEVKTLREQLNDEIISISRTILTKPREGVGHLGDKRITPLSSSFEKPDKQ